MHQSCRLVPHFVGHRVLEKLKMFRLFVTVGLALVLNNVFADACFCTADYKPYCGTDGKTYSNKCQLECAQQTNPGLRVKFEGVCAVPYQPGKGASPNQNQVQGAESKYNPQYVQPPRGYNPNPGQYYPGTTPRSNTNYFQQSTNQKYAQIQPPRYNTLPPTQYYPTVPSKQYYPTTLPPRQYYPTTLPPRQYYPTISPQKDYYPQVPKATYTLPPRQIYPPKQTYTVTPITPPRQTYYQPRPTPQLPTSGKYEDQSWVPTFGGGYGNGR